MFFVSAISKDHPKFGNLQTTIPSKLPSGSDSSSLQVGFSVWKSIILDFEDQSLVKFVWFQLSILPNFICSIRITTTYSHYMLLPGENGTHYDWVCLEKKRQANDIERASFSILYTEGQVTIAYLKIIFFFHMYLTYFLT